MRIFFKKLQVAAILTALENAGVSLQEPDQIVIPWALNYPTIPEKAWEVNEDISDKLDEADKLVKYFKKESNNSTST